MFENLKKIEKRFDDLSELLCKPEVVANLDDLKKYSKEQSDLQEIVTVFREYEKQKNSFDDNLTVISEADDEELAEMAREENEEIKAELAKLEEQLKLLLIPKDPDDKRNAIVEIRAGTGGEEAGLFALDVYNMYQRYAQKKGFKTEALSVNQGQAGGLKEVIFTVTGKDVFKYLRYESGVHRVQRVPKTETQGRVHTSAITVAVFPEIEEAEITIDDKDLKIDIYRSSGPGGQSVNTTDSAVRITHLPTGISVAMQDEKSQHKNREKGMKVIASRVQSFYREQEKTKQDANRKQMIGSGDRSERIRTYNFPQGRLTDHRINLTLYNLEQAMLGDLDEVVENLQRAANAEAMAGSAGG
jgi:peptide chain release factor 1